MNPRCKCIRTIIFEDLDYKCREPNFGCYNKSLECNKVGRLSQYGIRRIPGILCQRFSRVNYSLLLFLNLGLNLCHFF